MTYHKSIVMFALVTCALVLTQVGAAATADFFTVPSYPVSAATSIATGDFNNDGITDVATAGASKVSVLLGNKNGTFKPAVDYTVTTGVAGIGVGDFNNDGRPDIVVLITTGSVGMNLLLGNGDGTFQTAHSVFFQGLNRAAFVIADFNKDGNLDIAVANKLGHNISVLLGTGTGSFQTEVNYSAGSGRDDPESIALGDVNNDGKLDLVSGEALNAKIFLGNGDGTFQVALSGPAASGNHVFLADLNNDGKLDLLGTFVLSGPLELALGNGDGSFQNPVAYTVGASSSTQTVTVLDVNNDGKEDVVVTGEGTGDLSVMFGNGDGTLQTPVLYAVGLQPLSVVSGEFGVGQKPGLAVSDGALLVDLAIVNHDGTLQAPPVTTVPPPQSEAVGDINGDGKTDVAIGSGGNLDILFGNGDGTFQAPVIYSQTVSIGPIAIGDLNGDGKADVVLASNTLSKGVVLVLLNNGDGTLGSPVTYNAGNENLGLALGDFNGDHKLDIAVTDFKDNTLSVLLNNGDGTFQTAIPTTTAFGSLSVATADFNGDGKLDAAVQGSKSISVLLGNGDGTFTVKNYSGGVLLRDVRAADFNNDGKPDLVASDYDGSALDVLLNKGDGTFGKAVPIPIGITPTDLQVGDFNGDGNQDIAVADATVIVNGKGDGTFQAPSPLGGCIGTFVIAANFNADSRLDLLNVCASQFVVFPNAAGPH